jgi:CheY-like chemotaxis protein
MKIMVVDDEADIVRLVGVIFEINNYEVIKAESGKECLKKLNEGIRPDIILLDLMMPEIDGFEICRKIKADDRFKKIPIIILSVKSDQKDIDEAYKAGVDGYITKPFDPQYLLKQVEKYIKITG